MTMSDLKLVHGFAHLAGWMALLVPLHAMAQTPPAPGSNQLNGARPAATASQSPTPGTADVPTVPSAPSPGEPGFVESLGTRRTLLGDAYGIRPGLARYGVSLGLTDTEEVLGNPTGGVRQGAIYEGLTQLNMGIDTQKAFGWQGGTFNVSALQIHGRGLTQNNLSTLKTVSTIEAQRATRLWELWYQQTFLGGRADLKVGQQSLDQEFITSVYGGVFVNSAFAWPVLTVADLYAGGPAFPLSSLGVRGRVQVSDKVTVLGGVFNDNPPGESFYDNLQVRGASQSGTSFNLNTGALFIAEVQYATNPVRSGEAPAAGQSGLPGVYKLGGWYDSGQFAVQSQTRVQGLARSGTPMRPTELLRHNWSIYATGDQAIWAPVPGGPQTVAVFGRAMGAPGDRNLVNVSLNGGVVLKAPFPTRLQDSVGIGFGYNRIGDRARLLDQQAQAAGDFGNSIRSSEAFIEATYQARLTPWVTAQPDIQYVINPGGNINKPDGSGQRVKNAVILGLRSTITF